MKLFDSLSNHEKDLTGKQINIYSCGPTVYNEIHIGNARPLIMADVLINFLKSGGTKVHHLMNITDIDDKIIQAAINEKVTEEIVTNKFAASFKNNLERLNITSVDQLVPISGEMPTILNFIQILQKNNATYEVDGNVYFDIEKYKNEYGKISHQKLDELRDGVRIENDENKKSPLDFVLWKKTSIGIQFKSPWGDGRPGWHTECVALIDKYFKGPINMHIGGSDLRFPHHENERIQFLAQHNQELADIWFHVGHVLFNNQKMSKSVGNVIMVSDFLKEKTSNDLRYIMLSSKYSQPININDDLIAQAVKWNKKTYAILKKINWMNAVGDLATEDQGNYDEYEKNIVAQLNNDFNCAQAVTTLDALSKCVQQKLSLNVIDKSLLLYQKLLRQFGFIYNIKNLSNVDVKKIKTWKQMIDKKDFVKADELRKILEQENII